MGTRKPNILPPKFNDIAHEIENFKVDDDDVWLVTNPKSGTYWMQEALCCLLHGIKDLEKLKSPNYQRSLPIETPAYRHVTQMPDFEAIRKTFWARFDTLERPRVMRTHLFWDQLPKALRDPNCKAKIVYLRGEKPQRCMFICLVLLSNAARSGIRRVEFQPYWNHVFDYWNRRQHPNILFVKYEEMKKDFQKVLDRLQVFLNLDPLTKKQKEDIADYLSFDKMKNNKSVQDFMIHHGKVYKTKYSRTGEDAAFMRKRQVGQWKTAMSADLITRFDDWILENTAGTGYTVDVD